LGVVNYIYVMDAYCYVLRECNAQYTRGAPPTRLDYPVELAAKLETGSQLPTDEHTPPDTTQLNSTCSVFNFFLLNPSAVVLN